VTVVVVLDACTDRSEDAIARPVRALSVSGRNVGAARAAGFAAAAPRSDAQSITHQQQHVIESALPILTPRHTPILSVHPTNPVQARRNRATKSAASWMVDRVRRRPGSRLPDGCSRC
jgi:hypothetical protein